MFSSVKNKLRHLLQMHVTIDVEVRAQRNVLVLFKTSGTGLSAMEKKKYP